MSDLEKISALNRVLEDMPEDCEDPGKYLFESGVEPKLTGRWLNDPDYKGESKDVFICSCCLHWQSVKKSKAEQKNSMKYCPFCGAKMEV